MTTTLATITSQKIALAAGVPVMRPGQGHGHITIQIPTGTTANVQTTCATDAEVQLDTDPNIWQDWPAGVKAGPYTDVLIGTVSAFKITSAAGGVVYIARSTN